MFLCVIRELIYALISFPVFC